MTDVPEIHKGKVSFRRQFLAEWLEVREMEPMDLVNALNEADTSLPAIDKSQIYKWLKGQLPHKSTQIRIAAALSLFDPETGEPDPERLMRDPDADWFAQKVRDRSREEIEELKDFVERAIRLKTGTRE